MKGNTRTVTDSKEQQEKEKWVSSVDHAGNDRLGLDRLIFFSDAIFAIAITLLALDINLPPGIQNVTDEELWRMIAANYHDYTAYAISFLVIGFFWLGHHTKFRSITRYDGVMIWLNILLLMTIAFIPFPTRVMSDYINSTSTIFYAATIVVAGLLTASISLYAVHNNRLVDPDAPLHGHVKQPWLLIGMPLIFLLSIPIAVYDPLAARAFWLLLIPLEILKSGSG